MFQSTRPYGARRALPSIDADRSSVSIHAPVRGATPRSSTRYRGDCVSIHAPVRGATRCSDLRVSDMVSIHAPVRGATTVALVIPPFDHCFNPRARTGRDASSASDARSKSSFNPRARTGRDPLVTGFAMLQCFNPRARTGRDRFSTVFERAIGCFNPRARTGRDTYDVPCNRVNEFQSTRPYGARRRLSTSRQRDDVSIHAPVRGATTDVSAMHDTRSLFQSTRPYGARRLVRMCFDALIRVSIHAPVRGATTEPGICKHQSTCFNPRARTGRDASGRCIGRCKGFNPRARTGRDRSCRLPQYRCFNPRARTGRDVGCIDGKSVCEFQSTRPYGARPRDISSRFIYVSIHAPVRGATSARLSGCRLITVSIHAPVRGATRIESCNDRATDAFQSTRPYGARPMHFAVVQEQCFNPRARTGRDESA